MKKIVLRFWGINLLISILLFVIYRIVISQTKTVDGDFLQTVLQFLDILLNLAYSVVYLIAMIFSSCAIFLNLIDKIRTNFYLSILTFLAIPLFCVTFIVGNVLINNLLHDISIFRNLMIFSIIYLFLNSLEFILFRKKIKKVHLQKSDNVFTIRDK